MGDVIHIDVARLKRRLPLPGRSAFLEERIAALLARLDESPEVAAEILRLRNEIWLTEARDTETLGRRR
ncbi:MAG: hypothetical protein WDN31_14105 [Hyphomicrobium sp.]